MGSVRTGALWAAALLLLGSMAPDGARERGGVQRSEGCVRLNMEDVSTTSVQASYAISRPVTERELRDVYDRVAIGAGWHSYVPDNPLPALSVGEFRLSYCRTTLGTISLLDVWTQPPRSVDVRPSNNTRPSEPVWEVTSGVVVVGIRAAPGQAACP